MHEPLGTTQIECELEPGGATLSQVLRALDEGDVPILRYGIARGSRGSTARFVTNEPERARKALRELELAPLAHPEENSNSEAIASLDRTAYRFARGANKLHDEVRAGLDAK